MTYIALKVCIYIFLILVFSGNQTHDLAVGSVMHYCFSYRKAQWHLRLCNLADGFTQSNLHCIQCIHTNLAFPLPSTVWVTGKPQLHLLFFFSFNKHFYSKWLTLHSHLHFITKDPITFTFMLLTLLNKATYIAFKVNIRSVLVSLGNEPTTLLLLVPCSAVWAIGKPQLHLQ